MLKYAAWLKTEYSIAPKEIVALDFMNSPKFVFIWLAIWSLGANPALINYNLTSEPLLHCVRTSTARIIFFDDEIEHNFSDSVRSALQSSDFRDGKGPVEMVRLDAAMERVVMSTDGIREPDSSRAGADNHQMAILIYTSGTTGNPKPAIIPWVRTCTGGDILHNWMGLKKSDRFYTVCSEGTSPSNLLLIQIHSACPCTTRPPLFWDYCLVFTLALPLYSGTNSATRRFGLKSEEWMQP